MIRSGSGHGLWWWAHWDDEIWKQVQNIFLFHWQGKLSWMEKYYLENRWMSTISRDRVFVCLFVATSEIVKKFISV